MLTRKGVVEGENKPEEENTVNSEVECESHDFVAATEIETEKNDGGKSDVGNAEND